MAIKIITNFDSASQTILDARSGPYYSPDLANTDTVVASLPENKRSIGLSVVVCDQLPDPITGAFTSGNLSVWIFDGGIDQVNLVPFGSVAEKSIIVQNESVLASMKPILKVKQWYLILDTATFGHNQEVQIKFKSDNGDFFYEAINNAGIIELIKI